MLSTSPSPGAGEGTYQRLRLAKPYETPDDADHHRRRAGTADGHEREATDRP